MGLRASEQKIKKKRKDDDALQSPLRTPLHSTNAENASLLLKQMSILRFEVLGLGRRLGRLVPSHCEQEKKHTHALMHKQAAYTKKRKEKEPKQRIARWGWL